MPWDYQKHAAVRPGWTRSVGCFTFLRLKVAGWLTFLSIISRLQVLHEAGAVVRYVPTVPPVARGLRRSLLLSREAFLWCCPPGQHPDARITDECLADLQFVLNSFAFYHDMEPGLDVRHLEPKDNEVWEFRSYVKQPRLRLFGSFALPSVFVATDYRVRDDLEESRGPKWDAVINNTKDSISELFGEYLPFSAYSFREYFRGGSYE